MIIGNNNGILLSIKKPTTCDLRLVADAERYVYSFIIMLQRRKNTKLHKM
jgi:hypothetical protein